MCESFWWSEFSSQIGLGFSRIRAAQLHKAGLQKVGDVWNGSRFLSQMEVAARFGLRDEEAGAWAAATNSIQRIWGSLVTLVFPPPRVGEWIGCFRSAIDPHPELVLQFRTSLGLMIGEPTRQWLLPRQEAFFEV